MSLSSSWCGGRAPALSTGLLLAGGLLQVLGTRLDGGQARPSLPGVLNRQPSRTAAGLWQWPLPCLDGHRPFPSCSGTGGRRRLISE